MGVWCHNALGLVRTVRQIPRANAKPKGGSPEDSDLLSALPFPTRHSRQLDLQWFKEALSLTQSLYPVHHAGTLNSSSAHPHTPPRQMTPREPRQSQETLPHVPYPPRLMDIPIQPSLPLQQQPRAYDIPQNPISRSQKPAHAHAFAGHAVPAMSWLGSLGCHVQEPGV